MTGGARGSRLDDAPDPIASPSDYRQMPLSLLGADDPAEVQSRTPPEERERFGLHAERGPESFDLLFRMLAGHDRFHLEQMRRTLEAVG